MNYNVLFLYLFKGIVNDAKFKNLKQYLGIL